MPTTLIQALPVPLRDDLATGRWLPILGAGLSRNAIVSDGDPPLLWEPLAEQLAGELSDYVYGRDPVDALSAYEQEHGRNRLVERVSALLRVHDARPGPVHRAFCQLGFQRVVTTNFDMLLERQYEALQRPCLPLVEEAQLAMANPYPGPALLKLHGDVHHPHRLVLTEDDYDSFLRRYPLLATHMASLLIDHTAILVGYSLADPDMRQLLSLVVERLGGLRRPLYALLVGADALQVNRFLRRGVKPVVLPGSRNEYASVLTRLFEELRDFLNRSVIDQAQPTREDTARELRLPPGTSRLCYFAVPLSLLPWYQETLFPVVAEYGLIAVNATEVITPDETGPAKIDALVERAGLVVADLSTRYAVYEFGLALRRLNPDRVLGIVTEDVTLPLDIQEIFALRRPSNLDQPADSLVEGFRSWVSNAADKLLEERFQGPERLLAAREYNAAVVTAAAVLESELRIRLERITDLKPRAVGLRSLLDEAVRVNLISPATSQQLASAIRLRNRLAHSMEPVPASQARRAVSQFIDAARQLSSR
jgi:hypothetical protein